MLPRINRRVRRVGWSKEARELVSKLKPTKPNLTGLFDLRDIKEAASLNNCYRKVLFTSKYLQLVVMSLLPGQDIGSEVHKDADQFFKVERGSGVFYYGTDDPLPVGSGFSILIPAGVEHNITNVSKVNSLKLYTIYSPPHHGKKLVQAKK